MRIRWPPVYRPRCARSRYEIPCPFQVRRMPSAPPPARPASQATSPPNPRCPGAGRTGRDGPESSCRIGRSARPRRHRSGGWWADERLQQLLQPIQRLDGAYLSPDRDGRGHHHPHGHRLTMVRPLVSRRRLDGMPDRVAEIEDGSDIGLPLVRFHDGGLDLAGAAHEPDQGAQILRQDLLDILSRGIRRVRGRGWRRSSRLQRTRRGSPVRGETAKVSTSVITWRG